MGDGPAFLVAAANPQPGPAVDNKGRRDAPGTALKRIACASSAKTSSIEGAADWRKTHRLTSKRWPRGASGPLRGTPRNWDDGGRRTSAWACSRRPWRRERRWLILRARQRALAADRDLGFSCAGDAVRDLGGHECCPYAMTRARVATGKGFGGPSRRPRRHEAPRPVDAATCALERDFDWYDQMHVIRTRGGE